jgi:FG-GAP-like repeat
LSPEKGRRTLCLADVVGVEETGLGATKMVIGSRASWFIHTLLGLGGLLLPSAIALGADEPRLADYFGFLPLEIYKLDPRISNVLLRDVDGDGINDVLVVNNGRSRIDLLLSSKGPADPASVPRADTNQVPSDRRMRLKSLPVNKEVVSLQTGDFNSDGKADLAYYGTPAELIVVYGQGGGRFGNPRHITTGEAVESGTALTVGDLNRDGRDDLALLTSGEVITILQVEGGKLGDPERLPHTAAKPSILKAVDLDGDGGDDLVLLDLGNDDPVRVRFSSEGGKLGPEQRFTIESPRAIAFANLDGKPGAELLTIEGQSGRAKVFGLDDSADEDSQKRGRLIFYPLPRGDVRGRSLAVGDLDGDRKADVVVSDPANAQFLVYRQGKGGLGTSQSFPGLVGGRTVRVADLNGDGKAEVVVLSEQEKQIGQSVLAGGRLTFPAPLPTSGDPVALDVADLDADHKPEVIYISKSKTDGTDTFTLRGLKRETSGSFIPFRWGSEDAIAIRSLSGSPPALRVLDANHDGQSDILIFNSFGPPVLLLGRVGQPPAPAGGGLGPLTGVTPAGLTLAQLDGKPALLVAQNTFARNLALDKDGHWEVKDQYNSARSSAQVLGATVLGSGEEGKKEIVLLDRTSKSLLYLALKDGVYRVSGTLAVGAIDFQGLHVADLDGDGHDDLLIAGTDKFGVVLTGRKGQRLKSLAGYESNREKARLSDLAAGDLNSDGQPDIVLTDTAEHFIEIATYADQAELDRAIAFKIFEQKSLQDIDDLVEPRDLAIGDVDGDGKADLVLIVHDRILIYRQDVGRKDAKTADK